MNIITRGITLLYIFLTMNFSYGQKIVFQDISLFDSSRQISQNILIYFHFEGCPPCKKMDNNVFSQDTVQRYLSDRFDCYSVFGFDSIAIYYRNWFGNKGNPNFMILDRKLNIQHKFGGYHTSAEFIKQCELAFGPKSLQVLDSIFNSGNREPEFLSEYIPVKKNANELDSVLIFEYLNALNDSCLANESHFINLLQYGYDHGKTYIKYGSKFYSLIEDNYDSHKYAHIKEEMRNRLLFSMHRYYYLNRNTPYSESILKRMSELENGNLNLLKNMDNDNTYAMINSKYPSFKFRYELLENNESSLNKLLETHLTKINNDSQELNSIAWKIYIDEYSYSATTGIDLVKKAISINPKYSYIDTYAALLFKTGAFQQAKTQAELAINIAREGGSNPGSTIELLAQINESLNPINPKRR